MTSPTADDAGRLVVAGVTKSFATTEVLCGVDLDIAGGSIAAVLGPSGCGKTTLLRIVAGFLAPDRGRVALGSTVLVDGDHWVPPEKRGIGIVPQEGALFPHLSVAGNVGFGLARGAARDRRVNEVLEMVGLRGFERARPFELSGGQQQRIALARALAPQPALLLLDEPFSSLDASLRVKVRDEVIAVLRQAGCTAVLVTHDQQEALSVADLVAVMLDGVIAQAATPRDLYAAPSTLEVAAFVGDAVVLQGDVAGGVATTSVGRHELARPLPDGPAVVVVRPEQFVVAADGAPATVLDRRFYGHDATIRCRLATGEEVTARITGDAAADGEVRLRVSGEVLAYAVTA